jgi:hypothetical protein
MRYFTQIAIAGFLLTMGAASCDEIQPVPDPINPPIQWPSRPVITQPDDPLPIVNPVNPVVPQNDVGEIRAGELYVVEWPETEYMLYASPECCVSVLPVTGPVTLFAKFSDGIDRNVEEMRSYESKQIYVIRAVKAGTMELIAVPHGATDVQQARRKTLVVMGLAPIPPPTPIVDPEEPVDPVIPIGKIQVVIIEDPAERGSLPASQISVMDGQAIRQYAKTHCSDTDGTPDFRVLSLRQDVTAAEDWVVEAFAVARPSVPFIVILTGSKTVSGPLPKTVDETLTLLKTYGGD